MPDLIQLAEAGKIISYALNFQTNILNYFMRVTTFPFRSSGLLVGSPSSVSA